MNLLILTALASLGAEDYAEAKLTLEEDIDLAPGEKLELVLDGGMQVVDVQVAGRSVAVSPELRAEMQRSLQEAYPEGIDLMPEQPRQPAPERPEERAAATVREIQRSGPAHRGPRGVTCPRCQAAPGERCDRRTLGRYLYHRARVEASSC